MGSTLTRTRRAAVTVALAGALVAAAALGVLPPLRSTAAPPFGSPQSGMPQSGAPPSAARSRSRSSSPVETAPVAVDLAGTGLYADAATFAIAEANRPFTPQYPLWSDGAQKKRWIHLPRGAAIDASAPDAWRFPVGTKVWKEFSFGGRRVETRYVERNAEGWRFATYVWSEDGRAAILASPRGHLATTEVVPGVRHTIPSEGDCRVCHGSGDAALLGFSALQLSGDRDPGAVHGEEVAPASLDLPRLVAEGWLQGYRGTTAPRIAARTPIERASLGYLHGNCGGCHRASGTLASLGMVLASSSEQDGAPERAPALATTLGRASRVTPSRERIAAGDPARSVLVERMRSRTPTTQMPPLGTRLADEEALGLISRWIEHLPNP